MGQGAQLPVDAKPSEIVDIVGVEVAGRLADFQWRRSGSKLSRQHDGNHEEISFQGSRYNRTGSIVEIWLYGRTSNKALGAWRAANPQLALRHGDMVFGGLAGNILGTYKAGQFQFTPGDTNVDELSRLFDFIKSYVVPWLELGHDPEEFVERAPSISLDDPSAAEWLLSLDRLDLAAELIRRAAGNGSWASAFASGRRKALEGADRIFTGPAEQWGWLAVASGLGAS